MEANATAPTVEVAEHVQYPHPNFGWRRPVVYIPQKNHVLLGPPGATHDQLGEWEDEPAKEHHGYVSLGQDHPNATGRYPAPPAGLGWYGDETGQDSGVYERFAPNEHPPFHDAVLQALLPHEPALQNAQSLLRKDLYADVDLEGIWDEDSGDYSKQPETPPYILGRKANILDPIHDTLDGRVWDKPGDPEPRLKAHHRRWIQREIYDVAKRFHPDPPSWLSLVFTGSLTTYQYSDASDVDVSLFVNPHVLPEWKRGELIGLMVENLDGTRLPGTPFPLQCFVVGQNISKHDLYQSGLRSGYDIDSGVWLVPPERSRAHDVEKEYNADYVYALESADKMERLLRYDPDRAVQYWHQIHKRRRRDQAAGKGDYSQANIVYKFLANRGLFPDIANASGEYIAHRIAQNPYNGHMFLEPGTSNDIQTFVHQNAPNIQMQHADDPLNCRKAAPLWGNAFAKAGIPFEHIQGEYVMQHKGFNDYPEVAPHEFLLVGNNQHLFDPTAYQFHHHGPPTSDRYVIDPPDTDDEIGYTLAEQREDEGRFAAISPVVTQPNQLPMGWPPQAGTRVQHAYFNHPGTVKVLDVANNRAQVTWDHGNETVVALNKLHPA